MDRSDEVHVNLFLSWSYLQSFSATLHHDMCTKFEHYIHNHNNLKKKAKGLVSWLYAKAVGSEPSIMDIQDLKPCHVTCMAITLVDTRNLDRQ